MGGGWRAFVGLWDDGDPEWTRLDERHTTWEAARDLVAERLGVFRGDDCPHCRGAAVDALERLAATQEGTPFVADVDGDDYLIVDESVPLAPPRRTGGWVEMGWVEMGSIPDDSVPVLFVARPPGHRPDEAEALGLGPIARRMREQGEG